MSVRGIIKGELGSVAADMRLAAADERQAAQGMLEAARNMLPAGGFVLDPKVRRAADDPPGAGYPQPGTADPALRGVAGLGSGGFAVAGYDASQAWRIVKVAALRAEINPHVSCHWLRHVHASHALDRGAPIHLVQQTLGHASVATTGVYLHARPTDSSARYLGL